MSNSAGSRWTARALAFLAALGPTGGSAWADPCGMVPPIYLGEGVPIARVGLQKTYVFYQDGVESIVLRPGFSGKVEEFGMLIPFPAVPEIRKVSENSFVHLAAAIAPPTVKVDLRPFYGWEGRARRSLAAVQSEASLDDSLAYKKEDVVVVHKEEAVGMYEVAVLEAGSIRALEKWMGEHDYVYPEGMDEPVAGGPAGILTESDV